MRALPPQIKPEAKAVRFAGIDHETSKATQFLLRLKTPAFANELAAAMSKHV